MCSGFHLESNRNSDVTSIDNDWGLQDRDRHIYYESLAMSLPAV